MSVLDLVNGMSEATEKPVPHVVAPRCPGDVATTHADPNSAHEKLGQKEGNVRGCLEMAEE